MASKGMIINGSEMPEEFYRKAEDYWSEVEPNVDGMLGGFPKITSVDIKASNRFISKYFVDLEKKNEFLDNKSKSKSKPTKQLTRALDCGSGIGRVTKHLLLKYFDCVDQLEQNQKFLNETKEYLGPNLFKRIGIQYNNGLQDFTPDPDIQYDCIWIQWVVGYLTDDHFVRFLVRCKSALKGTDGLIVVKDNTTSSDESDADTKDGSVTRPHSLFLEIFRKANLTLICERKQYKMPKGLYPVYMFALR